MNKRSAESSKKRILEAAFDVFSQHGYQATSMRMIAARAGISVGGLYLYFEHKESLYATLMEKIFEDLSEELEAETERIEDPVLAFSTFIRLRLTYAGRNRELIIANNREPRLALGHDLRKRFFERQRRLIERILGRGVESGVFDECDRPEAAKVILAVLRGFVFSLVVDKDNLFAPEECIRIVLRGLLKRGSEPGGRAGEATG